MVLAAIGQQATRSIRVRVINYLKGSFCIQPHSLAQLLLIHFNAAPLFCADAFDSLTRRLVTVPIFEVNLTILSPLPSQILFNLY